MKRIKGSVWASVPQRIIRIDGRISLKTHRKVLHAIRDMQRQNLDPIVIIIGSSRGGCATAGCALYGTLRNAASPIYTVVEKLAWSAACYIFLAGRYRVMFEGAKIGLHSTTITRSAHVGHRVPQIYKDLSYGLRFDARLVAMAREATGLSKKKVWEFLMEEKDVFFRAQDALQLGLATDIANKKIFYRDMSGHFLNIKKRHKKASP